MTAQQAKELSLEIWNYLAEHPEITHKTELPYELFAKIKDMVLYCPLCEYFLCDVGLFFTCSCCPLHTCSTHNSLHTNWARSVSSEDRGYYARKIANAIDSWDPGTV